MDEEALVIKEIKKGIEKEIVTQDEAVALPSSISPPYVIPEHLYELGKSQPDDHSGEVDGALHHQLTVKHITAVGAIYDPRKGLSPRDRNWLRYAIDCCIVLGFSLSREFQVMPLNLWDGCDFLDESFSSIPTDLLIACLVCNPKTANERSFCGKATMFGARSCRASGHHSEEDSWRRAVERSGAKVVVTFFDIDHPLEVRACDLKGPNYAPGPNCTVSAASLQPGIATRQFMMETLLRKDIVQMVGKSKRVADRGLSHKYRSPKNDRCEKERRSGNCNW